MAGLNLSPKRKLVATIAISFVFFVAEIVVAFLTRSLALLADAFHYMNDLIGFIVALTAIIIQEKASSPQDFSFGWARASLLGAFFNGVFLLALGISIFLQSIERFITVQEVDSPKLVLIMGCIGLTLNIISATLLHEHHGHDHAAHQQASPSPVPDESDAQSRSDSQTQGSITLQPWTTDEQVPTPRSDHAEHRHTVVKLKGAGRDLGIMGVFVHVVGDALNNVGVIIAALVIWLNTSHARFYADPAASTAIAIMILLSSLPLVKNSGTILMQSAPIGVELSDVKHDIEQIPGIESVHELHIWRLDQKKVIASAHVVVSNEKMTDFMDSARTVSECLHAYGIHSATLQPELENEPTPAAAAAAATALPVTSSTVRRRRAEETACHMACGSICKDLRCCASARAM